MKIRNLLVLLIALITLIICILFVTQPEQASDEYKYTIDILFKYLSPLLALTLFGLLFSHPVLFSYLRRIPLWLWAALFAIILFLIPAFSQPSWEIPWNEAFRLSLCWIFAAIFLALFFFGTAVKVNRRHEILAGILCLIGTLSLGFACVEGWYLATRQPLDGIHWDGYNSKYVKADQGQPWMETRFTKGGVFMAQPKHPSASVAHRSVKYDDVLFDVRYTFDEKGHRILPRAEPNPKADLFLFGCSFTFGEGLENDETWPWLLATRLGSQWQLINYATSGFGAQQMLYLIEEGEIEKPEAPFRQALFFAIKSHLIRFTGLFNVNSIRYVWRDGQIAREGFTSDAPYAIVPNIRKKMNGSQAAREFSYWLEHFITRNKLVEFKNIYLAMIEKAALLLKDKYGMSLTVLLWPDIEDIAPELEKRNIPVLFARAMLKEWDADKSLSYMVFPMLDNHPNAKASAELASGLYTYFIDLYRATDNKIMINNLTDHN